MTWDISAEIVSAIILGIILIYATKGSLLPTMKNQAFQFCLSFTFVSMVINILSTFGLKHTNLVPYVVNMILLMLYYLTTPLMGMMFFIYTLANIYEHDKGKVKRTILMCSIPAYLYVACVCLNPFTHGLFVFTQNQDYIQGPWLISTYIIFFIYVALCGVVVWIHRQSLDKTVRYILAFFPLLSSIVIIFQYFYPHYILTGTAATCALLIIYLYLQNKQMFTDTLTDLLNRQEFNKMMEIKLKDTKAFTVFVLSLKDFKFINDKFGQNTGDEILLQICNYLKQVMPKNSLYRYGGDEFAILIDDENQKNEVLERISFRLSNPWMVHDMELMLNYVIGGVSYPQVADTSEEMIKGLEYAVAKAKTSKEQHICFCSKQMLIGVQRKYEILSILKSALDHNSFQVYYQPIYDLKKQRYRKAEALLRLYDEKLGFISPEEFIPIAEEHGLIVPMTYQVLDQACKFVQEIKKRDIEFVGISVNFSIVMFMQEDLEQKVMEIIEHNDIEIDKIKIEITESMLATNYGAVVGFMRNMIDRGVQFLLDDFGTGYSNISYVLTIPFHTIKIDKSLVWMSMQNPKAATVVAKMCEAFLRIGQHVLVEGIETTDQIAFVSQCGCDYLQGFYYAKPVPKEEALRIIQDTIILQKEPSII